MVSNSHESTRRSKHRRSPDDDSVDHTKRRKHRHHRHNRHDDVAKDDVSNHQDEVANHDYNVSRHVACSRPDYDVEEVEIIEEADGIHSAHGEVDPLGNKQKFRRDEEEEYQEKVAFQLLVDQEDDEVARIKEESRRILEKYKRRQQQHQQLHKQPDQSEKDDKEDVVGNPSIIFSKSPPKKGIPASERTFCVGGLGEEVTPKSERSGDMFCDDIFGDSPAPGVCKSTGKGDGLAIERSGGLYDNWDDAEGYYSFRFGEILDGRYEVTAAHGKGVFSTVVRAKDLKVGLGDPEEVAIKIQSYTKETVCTVAFKRTSSSASNLSSPEILRKQCTDGWWI